MVAADKGFTGFIGPLTFRAGEEASRLHVPCIYPHLQSTRTRGYIVKAYPITVGVFVSPTPGLAVNNSIFQLPRLARQCSLWCVHEIVFSLGKEVAIPSVVCGNPCEPIPNSEYNKQYVLFPPNHQVDSVLQPRVERRAILSGVHVHTSGVYFAR